MAGGFEASLIARVEPAKGATAVSSRAAEMEARPPHLGGGRHNRPTLWREPSQALQRSRLNGSALSRHEKRR
ncbi:hypothetical protein VZT92_014501 [Zoarces viviparus]|uniref:Uncharacterized protein n=1 Tax=Zoarces viviparus TaxID=48416 RepID=A0AAW1F0U4_ZOAVI